MTREGGDGRGGERAGRGWLQLSVELRPAVTTLVDSVFLRYPWAWGTGRGESGKWRATTFH